MFRNNRNTEPTTRAMSDPRSTVIRRKDDFLFRLADMLTNVVIFGGTGSGKSSGPASFLAQGYLAHNFGGLVLCVKPEECAQWQKWAAATGRTADLVIVDASAAWRFNFLNWEQDRPGEGGGLTINVVALLTEIAKAVAGSAGQSGGGDSQFFTDALTHLMTNAVDLCLFSGQALSLPLLRELVTSAPQTPDDVESAKWQDTSECWKALRRAHDRKSEMNPQELADFTETVTFWTREYPAISFKTRSIIVLMFALLSRPFTTRPLRRLFCEDSNIGPEACFDGKVIIIDLPTQEFGLAGVVAGMAWKTCFQKAVMRRRQPSPGQSLRPVFWWADECSVFLSDRDAAFASVCRSAYCGICLLVQNRGNMRLALGSDDTVDALLGNLQCKFFCQNSGETNEYAARLLGERWKEVKHSGYSYSGKGDGGGHTETAEQRRFYVEPSRFAMLKRGGAINGNEVEAIVYNGGTQYDLYDPATQKIEKVPYFLLTLPQETLK